MTIHPLPLYGIGIILTKCNCCVTYWPLYLIYSRFPIFTMLLINNNGCKVLEYCLDREPFFFRHLQILIDRLHFKNHVGCSNGHSVDAYDMLNPVNTQVAQQGQFKAIGLTYVDFLGDSTTNKVETQTAFMLLENFAPFMRFFLLMRNLRVKQRTIDSLCNQHKAKKISDLHKRLSVACQHLY